MKNLLQKRHAILVIAAMMLFGSANAQWAANGTHIYNTNTGKVGIGIGATTPAGALTVKGSGGVPAAAWVSAGAPLFVGFGENTVGNADYILNMASAAANARPVFIGRRSKGTLLAPTSVANNDFIMSFLASGYDGAAFQNPAGIDFYVDGVPAAGSVPARISFVTGSNSSNRAERLKIGNTGDFTFNTNQLFVQKSTGRVGIGTTTPVGLLHITGGDLFVQSSSGRIRLGYQGSNEWQMTTTNGGADLLWTTTTDGGTTTNYNHYFRQNGDVGIGTGANAPTARLDVSGNAASTSPVINVLNNYVGSSDVRGVQSVSKSSDGWGIGVQATGGYIGGYFISDAGAYASTGYGVYASASGSAGTRTAVYGYASGGTVNNWGGYFPTKTYTSELRVGGEQGASGFVAAINGKLIATEIRVQPQANWPDYVFGKDHILMSLEELEASININKHLPGIPSAAEVKDNGIMVGDMQSKAIEKIEENTLYILQLNNKVKEVEQINSNKSKEMELMNSKIKELEQKIEALTRLIK